MATEAAHVVASLSIGEVTSSDMDLFSDLLNNIYSGSDVTLLALLRANAPRALLYALSQHPQPQTRAALARALRAISSSIAEAVGPAIWGLRKQPKPELKQAATTAIEVIVSNEALDVYLPFLQIQTPQITSVSSATVLAIAQLLGAVLRTLGQTALVAAWTPTSTGSPATATTTRSKRGWEKMAQADVPTTPIVAKWLVQLLGTDNTRANGHKVRNKRHFIGPRIDPIYQLVEAALYALAALAKENSTVSGYLGRGGMLWFLTLE